MCHDRLSQKTSVVLEERIVEDALSCSLHKIGANLVEKVMRVSTQSHLVKPLRIGCNSSRM
jgi:hypothetical protein